MRSLVARGRCPAAGLAAMAFTSSGSLAEARAAGGTENRWHSSSKMLPLLPYAINLACDQQLFKPY